MLEPLASDPRVLNLDNLVASGHNSFRITNGRLQPVRSGNGAESLEVWNSEPGSTIVAEYSHVTLHNVWSYFYSLITTIGVPFRWSWPNIYFSHPGSGFSRHWDNHENFIVGLKGTKRFTVAPNGCVRYPEQNADNIAPHIKGFEKEIEAERTAKTLANMLEFDVGPGDCIFIPRGWWHEARALDEDSVTLTWAVWTCTWADLLAIGGIKVPAGASALTLRTPLPLDAKIVCEDLTLPVESIEKLNLLRAQAELRSIADITKKWRAAMVKGV